MESTRSNKVDQLDGQEANPRVNAMPSEAIGEIIQRMHIDISSQAKQSPNPARRWSQWP